MNARIRSHGYSISVRWTMVGLIPIAILIGIAVPCRGQSQSTRRTDTTHAAQSSSHTDSPRAAEQKRLREQSQPSADERKFESINLEVKLPGSAWSKVDVADHSPLFCFAMKRTSPDMGLLLLAEATGTELKFDNAEIVKLTKKRLLAKNPTTVFTAEFDDTRNGIKGVTFEASTASPQSTMYWSIWVATLNGYTYDVEFFGSPNEMSAVGEASRDFLSHLRQIEPSRVAHTASRDLVTKFKSNEFGYELDLTGLGWLRPKAAISRTEVAEFNAVNGRGSGLTVLSLPMPHRAPELEVLASSLLTHLNLDGPGAKILRTTPYKFGKLNCEEIEASRDIDGGKIVGRLRLIADDRCAYVLYGWSRADTKSEISHVQDSLDTFAVLPNATLDFTQLTEYQRTTRALILNDIGLRSFTRGDLVGSLDFFREALDLSPSNEPIAVNYLEVFDKLGRTDEGLAYLKDHEQNFAKSQRIRALHAKLLCQSGNSADGRKMYADLFADGCTDETALTAYLEAAITAKSYDEVITAIDIVLQKKPTPAIERVQASLYLLKGDNSTAVKMFEALHAKHSSDANIAIELAGAYMQDKQFDAALAVTQALLDAGNQDEAILIAHGSIQLRLEQMASAKQTFERAHELYPNSERINGLIKLASSQLGEGENSCVKVAIEAVEPPPLVTEAIERAGESAGTETTADTEAEEIVRVVGIDYEPGQPTRKSITERVKIYGPSGVARYSTLSYKFDPIFERLFVNQLIVRDETGAEVATGKVENYFVTDDTTSEEASNAKCLKIPVPGLKPGYTLECTVTRRTVAPAKDFTFQEISLASESPCRISAMFVQGAVDDLHIHASNGVQIKRSNNLLYAVDANTAPIRYEPHQPSIETFTPIVCVGSATGTWDSEAKAYLTSIQDRLRPDDTTKALAADITRGCATNREKLAAIAEHVQKCYTYHAIEFGRRALIPNTAAKTIAFKYGDCKDHALLTKQLLGAVGIESQLALVRTTSAVVEDVPSLEQFNHVVVFVPSEPNGLPQNATGGLFVDTTDKSTDPLLDPVAELADRAVMVLDTETPRFVHVPALGSDAGKITSTRTLSFDIKSTGAVDACVAEQLTLNAYLAPTLRAYLRHVDSDARREAIQTLLSHGTQVRIKHLEVVNLDAVTEPLQIKIEYTIPNSFHSVVSGGHKSLLGPLPCAWESDYAVAQAIDVRKTPFQIAIPRCIESSLTIRLPDGYQFSSLGQCSGSGRSKFCSWSANAAQTGNAVKIDYEVHIAPGRHPAVDYDQFYADMNDSLAVLQTPVTLENSDSHVETASRTNVGQFFR